MKVLIVQGSDQTNGGGVESFVRTLTQNHNVADIDFTILGPTDIYNKDNVEETMDNIRYLPIKMALGSNKRFLKILNLFIFNLKIFFSKKIYYYNYDVIHINGIAGSFFPIRFRNKCIFTVHGNSLDSFLRQRKVYNKSELPFHFINSIFGFIFEFLAVKFSKISVSVSPSVAKKFNELTKRRVYVIPNGIEQSHKIIKDKDGIEKKYNIKPGSFICLWVGRNPERKGLKIAIESITGIMGVYLLVVGIKNSDLIKGYNNVVLCGNVEEDELFRLYASSDLLIFPSSYEAMSYTIIEALSMGLPVISYRKNFMIDIVGSEYPLLCDSDMDFKDKIEDMLTWKSDKIINLKNICLDIGKSFNADKMAISYHKMYEEIINEKQ